MKKRFLYLLILLTSLLGLGACREFKEAQFTGVKGFKMNKMSMEGIDADIQIGIKNPNTVGFSIYPSEFDVIIGGVSLGKARMTKRVHIKANEEKAYTFRLKSDLKNVNMMELTKLMSGKGNRSVQIKGDLKAGKFYLKKRFPVNMTERIDLGF
jgi:LEA14-like dessication related protein